MAKWEGKHDSVALADTIRRHLGASSKVPRGALGEKRMFGGVCFLLNGNMLCGSGKNGYMFRIDPTRPAAADAPGGEPVVMQGRAMRGFFWVDPAACGEQGLGHWLELAVGYVSALPPKAAKSAKPAQAKRRR